MTRQSLRLGGVPEHFNLPWHLALESDSLDDLDLQWQDQHGGTGEMIANLDEGRLDVASMLTEGTFRAIADGLEVTVMQIYVRSPLHWGVFVPGPSRLQHESELEGARIAISRFGSGSHLMAYIQADRNGWGISDDQFVVVGTLDGAIEAFAAGRADLFLWDQFMTSQLVTNGSFRQLGVQKTPWPSFVIAARNEIVTGPRLPLVGSSTPSSARLPFWSPGPTGRAWWPIATASRSMRPKRGSRRPSSPLVGRWIPTLPAKCWLPLSVPA